MTKTQLIDKVQKDTGITKAQAAAAVKAMLDGFKDTLADGGKVQIPGFGSFSVKERAARQGRNPQTGAAIEIPAYKVVAFSAGKDLKAAVAPKVEEKPKKGGKKTPAKKKSKK